MNESIRIAPSSGPRRGPGLRLALLASILATLWIQGCDRQDAALCTLPERVGTLASPLHEASGIAASERHPGVFWAHQDSDNPPTLFAIDSSGVLLGQIRVSGARNHDWEAIALGPCPAGSCIYIADTGDNRLRRDDLVIYRVPEPSPGDTSTEPSEAFPIRLPDVPHDLEALYILPDGTLHLISKGRRHPVVLYRYPPPLRAGEVVTLEEVQRLTEGGVPLPDQVTGAAASPDGELVAVRSYSWLQLYRPDPDGRLAPVLPPPGLDLQEAAEPQGEGVAIRGDGTIFLISESGPAGVPGIVSRLSCTVR